MRCKYCNFVSDCEYEMNKHEQVCDYKKDGFYPAIIFEKIDDKHTESIFYDGTIAQIVKPNGTELLLIAAGEVKIYKKEDGTLIYDGKERNGGFEFELNDDTLRNRVYSGDEYYVGMNNWFEVVWMKKGDEYVESDLGIVGDNYDEGMELLKSYYEDDNY